MQQNKLFSNNIFQQGQSLFQNVQNHQTSLFNKNNNSNNPEGNEEADDPDFRPEDIVQDESDEKPDDDLDPDECTTLIFLLISSRRLYGRS
jgi:hypothetical protein